MSTQTTVSKLPTCDFHDGAHDAAYDFWTIRGWANGCEAAFAAFDGELGTGKGQRLILEQVGVRDQYQELMDRRELIHGAWMLEVEAAKARGVNGVDFWTHGVVLGSKGGLRLVARDREARPIFELAAMPGETEVTRTDVGRG